MTIHLTHGEIALIVLPPAVMLSAGVRSWLGVLNFLVLQWFGVRLARVVERRPIPGDLVGAMLFACGAITNEQYRSRSVTIGWRVVRWIWPLTGWWGGYRWITKRGGIA